MRQRPLGQRDARSPARRATFFAALMLALALATGAPPCAAQTTGRILGRVIDAETRDPVPTAEISIDALGLTVLTAEGGDFIMAAVPTGLHRVRVTRLGFRTTVVTVRVRPGRTTQVSIELPPTPVEVE